MTRRKWYDYLWIISSLYLIMGFVNILFAWLGLFCFTIPLLISIIKGTKGYCNDYCGRGQLLALLGARLSRNNTMPAFLYSKWFRYGFLAFFMTMFANMLFSTYLVLSGANDLTEKITLFWTFKLPWQWAYADGLVSPWVAQFAFGFYSLMLTSALIGALFMIFFRPRSWCVICPMGTMTQMICKLKYDRQEGDAS